MISLNIKLHSFKILEEIINENDTIRVSITTVPDMQKQAQTFDFKKIDEANISFKINFVGITEKIIITLRKKTFMNKGPIFASAVLSRENMNIYNEFINFESKKIDLYEPIQQDNGKINNKSTESRKIIGHADIDFSLKDEFSKENYIIGNEFFKKYNKMNCLFINEFNNPI
ncbi:hypothetical protein M9Y10_017972 [Tritrichomonas musculus]|uniref:Uncharacterized protein n=1 Tax=Tritrichomonas musculus TaxID=1915356 RepID=A0ABR2HV16_9EUKA